MGGFTQKISEGYSQCCVKCSMLVQVIFGLIWTALSIAMIVVGAMNLGGCPAQRFIPIYLIVAGAFSFSFWVLLPLEFCAPKVRKILSLIVALFCFAWFIAGSVWVFRIYRPTNAQCNTGMYLFAFSILIIQYIFIGFGIIFGLISCFCTKLLCCCKQAV
ncbi:transmembrane protein 272-like [Discoglossus pictus]